MAGARGVQLATVPTIADVLYIDRIDLVSTIEALTRELSKGDEAAYRCFYTLYRPRLERYLWVVTRGNETAVRDALQGTFTRVVRYIRPFSSEEAFWSWLTVLARSALSDENKKDRRYLAFLDRFKRHVEVECNDIRNTHADDTLNHLLEAAVSGLPAEERQLIAARYYNRSPIQVIAEQSQATEKAVQSKLARIRRKLKEFIITRLKNDTST